MTSVIARLATIDFGSLAASDDGSSTVRPARSVGIEGEEVGSSDIAEEYGEESGWFQTPPETPELLEFAEFPIPPGEEDITDAILRQLNSIDLELSAHMVSQDYNVD